MLAAALLALSLAHPYGYPPPPPPYPPPGDPGAASPPRALAALVLTPLGSSRISAGGGWYETQDEWHGGVALELRGPRGGGRVRLGAEATAHDRLLEVALKYNFLDRGPLQPFLAVGIGAGQLGPETAWRGAISGSGGIDLYLRPDLFFTAELKWRAFGDLWNASLDAYGPDVSMTSVHFGVGVYF